MLLKYLLCTIHGRYLRKGLRWILWWINLQLLIHVTLFLKNKNNFFSKNRCEIQVRTILICTLYSIKYSIQTVIYIFYVYCSIALGPWPTRWINSLEVFDYKVCVSISKSRVLVWTMPLMIIIQTTLEVSFTLLESSVMLIESIYRRGVTHYDRHIMIKILL